MADMITVSNDNVFSLTNDAFSYVFRVSPEGILEHLHYGGPLSKPLEVPIQHIRTQRGTASVFQGEPDYNLSDTPQEFLHSERLITDFQRFMGVMQMEILYSLYNIKLTALQKISRV